MTKHRRRKSNPFNMFGSYAGALIGFLIQAYNEFGFIRYIPCPIGLSPDIIVCTRAITNSFILSTYIIAIILGFLIGWAIHLIFRKQRRRK